MTIASCVMGFVCGSHSRPQRAHRILPAESCFLHLLINSRQGKGSHAPSLGYIRQRHRPHQAFDDAGRAGLAVCGVFAGRACLAVCGTRAVGAGLAVRGVFAGRAVWVWRCADSASNPREGRQVQALLDHAEDVGAAGEALDAAIVADSVQLVGLIRSHRVQPSGF